MKSQWTTIFAVMTLVAMLGAGGRGQDAAVAPVKTIWQCLDVKGVTKHCDTLHAKIFNHSGDFPGLEKKPPLLMLTDAEGPVGGPVAVAAEIKAEEDQASQKIKAIKYLATVGCNFCIKDTGKVDEQGNPILDDSRSKAVVGAFLESLRDCTESVRLTAVETIMQMSSCSNCAGREEKWDTVLKDYSPFRGHVVNTSKKLCATFTHAVVPPGIQRAGRKMARKCSQHHGAGESCTSCQERCCCHPEIVQQLAKMAYERRSDGCWYEPSSRVRKAAQEALELCCPSYGPIEILDEGYPLDDDHGGDDPGHGGDDPGHGGDDPGHGGDATSYDTDGADGMGGELDGTDGGSVRVSANLRPFVISDQPGSAQLVAAELLQDMPTLTVAPIARPSVSTAKESTDEPPGLRQMKGESDSNLNDAVLKPIAIEPFEAHGTVTHVDLENSLVEIHLDQADATAPVGSPVEVYHNFVMGTQRVALLPVEDAGAGWVVVRHMSSRANRVARGDRASISSVQQR